MGGLQGTLKAILLRDAVYAGAVLRFPETTGKSIFLPSVPLTKPGGSMNAKSQHSSRGNRAARQPSGPFSSLWLTPIQLPRYAQDSRKLRISLKIKSMLFELSPLTAVVLASIVFGLFVLAVITAAVMYRRSRREKARERQRDLLLEALRAMEEYRRQVGESTAA